MINEEQPHKIVTIEGNIGAGKSTLLQLINSNITDSQILKEPVCQWQAINGNPRLNLLDLFYTDPKRWAYTFQSYSLYSRLRQWTEFQITKPFAIAERSVLSDKFIFAVNGKKSGLFTEIEWVIYNDYFNWLGQHLEADKINGIIYLQTDPEICAERIIKRGRDEEKSGIPLEYLTQIHDRHEEWLVKNEEPLNYPVLCINGNTDFDQDPNSQNQVLEQIKQFLNRI